MEIRLAFPNEVDAVMKVIEDAVTRSPESAYDAIYEGKWQGGEPEYLVFHRIAVARDAQGQGVAQTFLEGLIEGFDYLDFRSDTHDQNKVMQHIFEKLGFKQVGKVPVDGERLAYQKAKSNV